MSATIRDRTIGAKAAPLLAMLALALTCLFLFNHHEVRSLVAAAFVLPIGGVAYFKSAGATAGSWTASSHPFAPLVAIVGCDGSGKSTLSTDMQAQLSADGPVERCYLGLGSGELGNRIKQLPLVGPPVERMLARKASRTRTKGEKIPGLATALVVFAFSLLRLRRFRHVLALRRRGVTVITDRYPQVEVFGFYDGPGLSAARAGSRAVAWLAALERRMYEWMTSFRPDLVLRLNVDADTALHRKPDHKLELLHAKVAATSFLQFGGARIVDIDACAPYESVREQALSWTRQALAGADRNRASAK